MDTYAHKRAICSGLREPLAIREGKHGIFVANLQWEEVRERGEQVMRVCARHVLVAQRI